jgi:uncharacterized protein
MMYWITPALLLLCSLLMYVLDRVNTFGQWLGPGAKRIREFITGFFVAATLCISTNVLLAWSAGASWRLNADRSSSGVIFSSLYDLNSVLAEELLFRGIILYLLLRYVSRAKALLISAVIFGVYHWFSQGVFGNIVAMALVLLITGLMGYVFALAYERTRSLVLPFAIHFGWNLVNNSIFSNGPNGLQILRTEGLATTSTVFMLTSFAAFVIVGVLLLLFVQSSFFSGGEDTATH